MRDVMLHVRSSAATRRLPPPSWGGRAAGGAGETQRLIPLRHARVLELREDTGALRIVLDVGQAGVITLRPGADAPPNALKTAFYDVLRRARADHLVVEVDADVSTLFCDEGVTVDEV